jgi:hypothetical protein
MQVPHAELASQLRTRLGPDVLAVVAGLYPDSAPTHGSAAVAQHDCSTAAACSPPLPAGQQRTPAPASPAQQPQPGVHGMLVVAACPALSAAPAGSRPLSDAASKSTRHLKAPNDTLSVVVYGKHVHLTPCTPEHAVQVGPPPASALPCRCETHLPYLVRVQAGLLRCRLACDVQRASHFRHACRVALCRPPSWGGRAILRPPRRVPGWRSGGGTRLHGRRRRRRWAFRTPSHLIQALALEYKTLHWAAGPAQARRHRALEQWAGRGSASPCAAGALGRRAGANPRRPHHQLLCRRA